MDMETVKEKLAKYKAIMNSVCESCTDTCDFDCAIDCLECELEKRGLFSQYATDTNDGDKWVSVDERLPEYGTCLVVVKHKYDWEDHYSYGVDVAQLCYENDPYRIDGKWITFNDWDEGQDEIHITHWMPLPAPPKAVQ